MPNPLISGGSDDDDGGGDGGFDGKSLKRDPSAHNILTQNRLPLIGVFKMCSCGPSADG